MSHSRAQSNADTDWTSALDRATPEHPVHVGHYTVVGLIASGGMGKVYDAIHRDHNARVALKTLVHVDVDRVMRFKNEFRYVADLCHPNLVPLYELSCHEGLWFITMERVDGVTFLDWVRPQPVIEPTPLTQSHARSRTALDRNAPTFVDSDEPVTPSPMTTLAPGPEPREGPAAAPPSLQRLREAFVQLARAVSALHAAGLLHLDLKPSNVLVDRSGRVVVLDFGLARLLEPRKRPESDDDEPVTISGTPTWMPPEQFELAALDESSDWYAVGLMLYVALTGTFPFPTTSVAAIWFAKKSARPVHPKTLVPELPRELCELAAALIKPEREDRPAGRIVLEQLSGERSSERATSARREFVGRAHERALLREALDAARGGDAVLAHVSGTSGLGKSALLRAFVDEARAQDETLVLRGRCYERETVPFKALDGIVDELAQHLERMPQEELAQRLPTRIADLARVFPSLMRVTAVARRVLASVGASSTNSVVELRRRASEALRRLLHLLCARGPVVLLIDDLQWADSDSAALLVGLIEAPAPPGMLLACSYRPDEAAANRALAPYFEQARARAAAHEIKTLSVAIAPLSLDESESLAASTLSRLGISSQSLIERVANESGGVPFFVEELAHYAAQRWLGREADSAELSLETVLSQRVRALDESERALVEVLSVANSPIPLDAWFAVARTATSSLRALWSLRGQHFVHSTGAQASDTVELHHDRMRESVYRALDRARIAQVHLGLARAFAARGASSPWLFDAVRHASAVLEQLEPDERRAIAELALAAGRAARQSAAFRLAFDSFRQGLAMLGERPFERAYELALALHSGAADAAYLCAEWSAVEHHANAVYAHSQRPVDRLQAWEAHIDSCCARKRYDEAVDVALGALALLEVPLPAHPTADEVGAYVGHAIERVSALHTSGVLKLEAMKDARTAAAMRIQTRIGSATYFARPALFPLLACNGVVLSTEHGIATATPYALSVFAVVLNSMGRFREAHTWGQVALSLLDRSEDRALDARTRHVVHDLVCVFTVPLESSLDDLRAVVELGEEIGDPEYAAYAAHAYVHNALWASRPLAALLDEAQRFHRFMLSYEQFNALHVHLPFEQLIRCLRGQTARPGSLDGDGFDEQSALAAAVEAGSRSAQFLLQMLMGIARYHFASGAEASALLEAARPFIDGVASTWHVPMFHQYAALAIYAIDDEAQRSALLHRALESEAALAPFAQAGADNFAHRVTLLRAERARVERRTREAVALYEQCASDAERSRFYADAGLARALAARALREDDAVAHAAAIAAHTALAHRAFTEWNASALLR